MLAQYPAMLAQPLFSDGIARRLHSGPGASTYCSLPRILPYGRKSVTVEIEIVSQSLLSGLYCLTTRAAIELVEASHIKNFSRAVLYRALSPYTLIYAFIKGTEILLLPGGRQFSTTVSISSRHTHATIRVEIQGIWKNPSRVGRGSTVTIHNGERLK